MTPGDEFGPERPASAQLPLYGVEGWPGQRRIGSHSASYSPNPGPERGHQGLVLESAEVVHSHGQASVRVTSYRQRGDSLTAFLRRVSENGIGAAVRERTDDNSSQPAVAPQFDEFPGQNVIIPVDGLPTEFQLWPMTAGCWVAAGRGEKADLTLDSRHVPVAGLALVRVTDLTAPAPMRLKRPESPPRHFPPDVGPAGDIPSHARVDLTFERFRLLSGSVGGQPVHLELNVPTHNGRAAGAFAAVPVSATWVNADNYHSYPDIPCDLTGSFGGQPVELHAIFGLRPGHFFGLGQITGHIGEEALRATVESAVPPPGWSSQTIAADGTLGSAQFTIYATIDGPRTAGKLRGTVAGAPIRIDAARTDHSPGALTRLTGSYQGPLALLGLTAGAFLHFI
jgi:hypothetical protein